MPSPILVGLWLAWSLLLFGGLVAGSAQPSAGGRMPRWTRLASSLALTVAAWAWVVLVPATEARAVLLPLALGMSFGLLGDLSMAGLLRPVPPVVGGLGAFALGHVAYGIGFLRAAGLAGVSLLPGLVLWVLWLALGLAAWYAVAYRGSEAVSLRLPALPYTLLLANTAGLGAALATAHPALAGAALGGALFLLSDLLIAARIFRGLRRPHLNDAIWLTYGPGQMLIVYSIGLWAAALPPA